MIAYGLTNTVCVRFALRKRTMTLRKLTRTTSKTIAWHHSPPNSNQSSTQTSLAIAATLYQCIIHSITIENASRMELDYRKAKATLMGLRSIKRLTPLFTTYTIQRKCTFLRTKLQHAYPWFIAKRRQSFRTLFMQHSR